MLDNLMGNPFSRFDRLGPCAEGHEVALDDVSGICRVEPSWQRPWKLICAEDILITGRRHDAYRLR